MSKQASPVSGKAGAQAGWPDGHQGQGEDDQGAVARPPHGPVDAVFEIGDLAREFGITTRTIRFYEEKGIVAPRRVGGVRVFSRRDRVRLMLALRGKRLGFSLAEVRQYLDLYDADPRHEAQRLHLVEKVETMLRQLREKQEDISLTIAELEDMLKSCQQNSL